MRQLIANEVYLGTAKVAGKRKRNSHKAIVTRREWDGAQSKRAPTRGKSEGGLLAGLLYCRTCGHRLTFEGNRYRCRQRMRELKCDAPAVISAAPIEGLLAGRMFEKMIGMEMTPVEPDEDLSALELAVEVAEDERESFLDALKLAGMDMTEAAAQIRKRNEAVEDARAALEMAQAESKRAVLPTVTGEQFYSELSRTEQREVLTIWFESISVTPGHGSVEQRVEVLEL